MVDLSPRVVPAPRSPRKGAQRIYEGPRLLKDVESNQPPPHLSLWQADRRERTEFYRGQLPPYFMYLAVAAISPLEDVEMDSPSSEDAVLNASIDVQFPNWYRRPSSSSPPSPRRTLPRPFLEPEAGLRLRHVRIASACTLFPELAVVMQTLLNKEIKAAMQREEMDLLAQIQNVASRPAAGPRGIKRRRSDGCPPSQSERTMKKLRVAAVTTSKPNFFVRRSYAELVALQPERSHLYASDFLDEEEILERAWFESMTRRVPRPDLRKSLLLDCTMKDIRRTERTETRFAMLASPCVFDKSHLTECASTLVRALWILELKIARGGSRSWHGLKNTERSASMVETNDTVGSHRAGSHIEANFHTPNSFVDQVRPQIT